MSQHEPSAPSGDDQPARMTRRRFLRGMFVAGTTMAVGGGMYGGLVEPYWPEFHDVLVPVRNLPRAFEGMRIAHLSDLHAHDAQRTGYLPAVVREVNRLRVDHVAVTGDLVTYSSSPVERVSNVIASLDAPASVVMGNHDYNRLSGGKRSDTEMTRLLRARGVSVLRNDVQALSRGGEKLHLVGLEDWWHGFYDPDAPFAKAPAGACTVVLSHNPDTVPHMLQHEPSLVLAGHTHGGQARIPVLGAPFIPVYNKQWDQGLFDVKGTQLYVSRGVGSCWPFRFNCRPDVPIITLTRA